jgi:putative membrane protein
MSRVLGNVILIISGLLLLLLTVVSTASGHDGQPLAPHDLPKAWNLSPQILGSMALTAALFSRGVLNAWQRAGRGRSIRWQQSVACALGLIALAIALVSPLDALSAALFSAHMLQHMVLMLAAAPLLAWGVTPALIIWTLPRTWRKPISRGWLSNRWLRGISKWVFRPFTATGLFLLVFVVWHTPILYQAALRIEWIHSLEHLTFLFAAWLYWSQFVHSMRRQNGTAFLPAGLSLFTLALITGLLSALITFSPQVWYPANSESAALWGLTSLQDQQLAGVVMWIPGGVVFLLAFIVIFWRGLSQEDRPKRDLTTWNIPDLPATGPAHTRLGDVER